MSEVRVSCLRFVSGFRAQSEVHVSVRAQSGTQQYKSQKACRQGINFVSQVADKALTSCLKFAPSLVFGGQSSTVRWESLEGRGG